MTVGFWGWKVNKTSLVSFFVALRNRMWKKRLNLEFQVPERFTGVFNRQNNKTTWASGHGKKKKLKKNGNATSATLASTRTSPESFYCNFNIKTAVTNYFYILARRPATCVRSRLFSRCFHYVSRDPWQIVLILFIYVYFFFNSARFFHL